MRAILILFALTLAPGCGGHTAPPVDGGTDALGGGVFGELSWRVRCDEARDGCAYPDRVVSGFDHDGEQRIQCSVVETATTRTLTFTALVTSDTGLTVMGAEIPRAGGSPSSARSCGTGALEAGAVFVGECGGAAPSVDQPCQMNVEFTTDAQGPVVRGAIRCAAMVPYSLTGETMPHRELTAAGDGLAAAMTAMTFSFHHCEGYVPD